MLRGLNSFFAAGEFFDQFDIFQKNLTFKEVFQNDVKIYTLKMY